MTYLDLDFVRPKFPALATDWALFDNAGGSVPLGGVIDRIHDYMSTCMVQVDGSYPQSLEATARIQAGHRAAEQLFGAGENEVALGSSSTVLMRTVSSALRPLWNDGDEVIVTDLDHETNIGPWRNLEATGITLREWRFNEETMRLELEDLEPLLNERTRLVAFTHCSNIVGQMRDDARRIVDRVHAAGALVAMDGVAYTPHARADVKALDVDLYVASIYKVFGPHISALYGRHELLARAASQNHFFIGDDEVPYKLEPGNVTHELAASLPAVIEYLEDLDRHHGGAGTIEGAYERIGAHETEIVRPLLTFLHEHPRAKIIGSPVAATGTRAPTVAFTVDGMKASEIPARLDERKVAVRWGHFYAHRLITRLGLHDQDGVVRASMAHYNSPEEVHRLVNELDAVL